MSNKIKITAQAEAFRLDLEHGGRFVTTTGKLHGGPVPGIGDMDRGVLPESYWEDATKWVYAVYHHETPILGKKEDGTWQVPMHFYSNSTSSLRNKMIRALEMFGATIETI